MSGDIAQPYPGRGHEQDKPSTYEELLVDYDQWRVRALAAEEALAAEIQESNSLRKQLGATAAELVETTKQRDTLLFELVREHQKVQDERIVSRSAQKVLERIASTDALTGLANRVAFDDQLHSYVTGGIRREGDTKPGAVVVIDLDKFKKVNDTAGHAAGDELLVNVADRLRKAVRPYDTVARYGGDEFAIIIRDATKEECAIIADRLLSIGNEIPPVGDGAIQPALSIGVRFIDLRKADVLLEEADAAMYRAKEAGGNRIEFIDS